MQAHPAPLGVAFSQGSGFPAQYRGLFVALHGTSHGSWNRSVPTGKTLVFAPLDGKRMVSGGPHDFAHWQARLRETTVGADGALFVSDDSGGRSYRIASSS